MKKILIVDDEERVRDVYVKALEDEGFIVRQTSDAREAFNVLVREDLDLVLVDIRMPEIDGKTMVEVIKEYNPKLKIIITSVHPLDKQKQMIPNALDYFDKSQSIVLLLKKINKILSENPR